MLPTRERYVAGFVDHLPEGAAMSVKHLAKQLPLYGQQAISTALTALSVAGHLRRVRCPVVGAGDETRWVFRTFWSRTAHDNEWWNTYLATEKATLTVSSSPGAPAPDAAPPPPWGAAEEPPPPAPQGPGAEPVPEPTGVPQQRTRNRSRGPAPDAEPATPAPDTAPATPPTSVAPTFAAGPSPAYLALARLGRDDHRLTLSADDCTTLEPQAAEWLARGVTSDYLTSALTAGLPARIDSPLGFLRRRLTDKIPPQLPTENTHPATPTPHRRILLECTDCGRPGPPEALPDGLCHPCRTHHHSTTAKTPTHPTEIADIKARMANLRDLLKPV